MQGQEGLGAKDETVQAPVIVIGAVEPKANGVGSGCQP